jgi:hypothetical protein
MGMPRAEHGLARRYEGNLPEREGGFAGKGEDSESWASVAVDTPNPTCLAESY